MVRREYAVMPNAERVFQGREAAGGCYFRINRTANTRVEKIKHPGAKFISVFLEKVMACLKPVGLLPIPESYPHFQEALFLHYGSG
jgi:hypothetical protein